MAILSCLVCYTLSVSTYQMIQLRKVFTLKIGKYCWWLCGGYQCPRINTTCCLIIDTETRNRKLSSPGTWLQPPATNIQRPGCSLPAGLPLIRNLCHIVTVNIASKSTALSLHLFATFEKFINHMISLLSEAPHFCKDWLEDMHSVLCWRARAGARTRGPWSRWPRRQSGSASGRSRGRAWWASLWTWARSCRGSCRTAGSRRTEHQAASCGCPAETHGSTSSILTFFKATKIGTLVWSKQSSDA